MLKNNDERRAFLLDPKNWVVKDSLPTLGIRVLEIKITNSISFIKFEKKVTQKDKESSYFKYIESVKIGDYIRFNMENDFYKLIDGEITKPSMSISHAVDLLRSLKGE